MYKLEKLCTIQKVKTKKKKAMWIEKIKTKKGYVQFQKIKSKNDYVQLQMKVFQFQA